MVKAYLRYIPQKALGLISTGKAALFSSKDNKYLISAALEMVVILDWRLGEVHTVLSIEESHSEVTALLQNLHD